MKFFDLVKEKFSTQWSMWLLIMLVAIWSIYIQDGKINRDGLLYLKQAYLIAEANWRVGLLLYPWPFFSIIIAIFHKITNLHLQIVAHGVDLVLFGLATLFYLKTLQFIYKKEKQIVFYGGVILLSFIPIMDDYVGMVLRDHGLWAGCMMGTYFYFKYLKQSNLKNSLSWQFGFLFASLFRPEGLVFLILLPLWNFIQKKSQNFKKLILDYSLCIFLSALVIFVAMLLNIDLFSLINSSRLTDFFYNPVVFFNHLSEPLSIKIDNKNLSDLFENYSLIITYAILLAVLFSKWIKGLGIFHGGLFLYSFFAKKSLVNHFQKHIYFFLIVSSILVSINLFNIYILTNRWWGFHWWWILILISPALINLLEHRKVSKLFMCFLSIFIILLIFNSLIDKSKNLEQQIALYIKKHGLTKIDIQGNEKIKYYINFSVKDLIDDQSDQSQKKYKLVKIIKTDNLDKSLIIKNFPEMNPKFSLINND